MRSISVFILFAFAACNPYSPDLGAAPFLCGPADAEQRCPSGYKCMEMGSGGGVCVDDSGAVPPDAGSTNCADDSSLEPNDMISTAWVTPVATTKTMFSLAGLAICPTGDTDNYSITIVTTNQNLEMLVEYDAGGAELQGGIKNSSGIIINGLASVSGMTGVKKAYVANLPPGTYYASVNGPAAGAPLTTNNYKLTLTVTGG